MRRTFLTLILSITLTGCFVPALGEALGDDPNRVALPTGGWIDADLQGAQRPITLEEADQADQLLIDSGQLPGDLAGYSRQYGVFPTDEGGQMVFVNAACGNSPDNSDWRQQQFLIMDGGDCFWHARVDITAGEVLAVSVNGES